MFNPNGCGGMMPPVCQREIVEPVMNRCIEKCCFHEVPHVCPIHTHVIHKHICHHTYRPCYTCSEESQIVESNNGSCCNY